MTFKIYTRAIIINEKEEVLLIKKNNQQKIGTGNWMPPGGTLEFGENPEETLIREIKEETDLDVIELSLLDTRKIIINEVHWLGLYYLVKVKTEQFTNKEPEKHEEIAWIGKDQLPNMMHRDLIYQKILGTNTISYNIGSESTNEDNHTMGKAIYKYVEIKMHHLIKNKTRKHIKVIPLHDRSVIISQDEKTGKIFNRKRPTAEIEGNTLNLFCFPGESYVKHYVALLNTYFEINKLNPPLITSYLPSKKSIIRTLKETNLSEFPHHDSVIVGMVEQLEGLFDNQDRKGNGDFLWKSGIINGKHIALLGCKFSFWGDIAGHLVDILASKGIKQVIYVGKLGGLKNHFIPNQMLATGCKSFVDKEWITRENPFSGISNTEIQHGNHYTSHSIIAEDKKWLTAVKSTFDFVDPEIGYMAKASLQNKISFGYLHIISNVLTEEHDENLSNERLEPIQSKRKELFQRIINYLKRTL